TIPPGPYGGLKASITPYIMRSTARMTSTGTEVRLEREMNNYLIPVFQFGAFTDGDMEIWPEPPMAFNGRIHSNRDLYLNGWATYQDKITVAGEIIRDTGNNLMRNGGIWNPPTNNVNVQVPDPNNPSAKINVTLTKGSMDGGPNRSGSPSGTRNTTWTTDSILPPQSGVNNRFGGYVLTRVTGAVPLKLPMQLGNTPTREIIKRNMPGETPPARPTTTRSCMSRVFTRRRRSAF
ncbi:MAG: hypothetical protein ACRD68_17325, partial [Pyrinomonadaceae bacterium]